MNTIGTNIKEIRQKNSLTQQELGDKLFVSDKTISSWESERTIPTIDMLYNISELFNITLFELMSGETSNNIETEIKLKVSKEEYDRIENIIKKDGKYLNEEHQNAIYYKPKNNEMKNKWLRIRKEGNDKILNLKVKQDKYSEEYEVHIDNDNNLKEILRLLDFEVQAEVDKIRKRYMYKNKYEVSFDNVKDLGLFVEIEIKKYEDVKEKEYEKLIELLLDLNIDLKLIDNKRYPEYFIKEKEK